MSGGWAALEAEGGTGGSGCPGAGLVTSLLSPGRPGLGQAGDQRPDPSTGQRDAELLRWTGQWLLRAEHGVLRFSFNLQVWQSGTPDPTGALLPLPSGVPTLFHPRGGHGHSHAEGPGGGDGA